MRTIIVDDEPIMINSFVRLSEGISIEIVAKMQYPEDVLEFIEHETVDLAVLDIVLPGMTGIELAKKLREKRPDILIVFITAHDGYIHEANQIAADDYIVKPYNRCTIERMAERMKLLALRQKKRIYIQTFGRFVVMLDGKPIPLRGKAKEILALVVSKRGKEISNEEIYNTMWEFRPHSNEAMKVYYNAIRRLKDTLAIYGLSDLLQSTPHGQIINTALFDCDYYDYLDRKDNKKGRFTGEFMSEYSWGEFILSELYWSNRR